MDSSTAGNTGNANAGQRQAGFASACMLFTAAMLVVLPVFAAIGYSRHGVSGLMAAFVAGGVCWFGACFALLLIGLLRGGPQFLHGIMLGMLFRMGVPLVTGIVLTHRGGPLAEAGVFGMIMFYYLFGLFVETLLSVRLVSTSGGRVIGTP